MTPIRMGISPGGRLKGTGTVKAVFQAPQAIEQRERDDPPNNKPPEGGRE